MQQHLLEFLVKFSLNVLLKEKKISEIDATLRHIQNFTIIA